MSYPKIDLHTHYLTPFYRKALEKAGHVPGPDGLPFTPDWSPEEHLAYMDKNNVAKAILSCSSPGTHLIPGDDEFAREVTRETNEYAAALKRKHPTRFGFFASLSLPDVQSALVEIDYALDTLDADGFVLLSNHQGMYLGDPRLAPVYAKLNARRAIVFVHPTAPCVGHACVHSDPARKRVLDGAPLNDAYPIPMMEFLFDSTRTFADLLVSGTAAAHPHISFIVPHCGSALPSVLDRVLMVSQHKFPGYDARDTQPISETALRDMFANQFYFDLAGMAMPNQIHHMLRWINHSRLAYGSDIPWTPASRAEGLLQTMQEEFPKLFTDQEIRDICEGNAAKLLKKRES
ncbi:Metallo-dependent hydrolase [Favolaschia claudopus]|uniref:6-methylsalicylate decarboxylase n=1 Tax=Favolaschia claudopus TaxID=2862362 RepID=A0AAW0BDC7_9AGAR